MSLSEEAYPAIKTFLDEAEQDNVQGFDQTVCDAVYVRENLQSFYVNQLFDFNMQTLGWEWQVWNYSRARLPDWYRDDPAPPAWLELTGEEGCP